MPSLLSICLSSLLAATLLNTLLRALRFSGEAGLGRLPEKYPLTKGMFDRWQRRWDEIMAMVSLLSGISLIATVWTAALLFDSLSETPLRGLVWVSAFCLLFLLLTRTLPGVVAEHYADRITIATLPLCGLLTLLLYPAAYLMAATERVLHLRLASSSGEGHRPSAEDEILTLVEESGENELDHDEKRIIRSVLEFGDTITREVMTPRVHMIGLEDDLSVAEAVRTVKDSPFSRFPVFHEDYDEILGMVHVKDLLRAMANEAAAAPVTRFMHKPSFVPESLPINDLLRLMKQRKIQTAIAVDEYGGTAGVVTLEDILEELVGEIEDEHDKAADSLSRQSDGTWLVDASMSIDEVHDHLGIQLPEADFYDSVGGFLLYQWGRIPKAGETYTGAGVEIRVRNATPRRIEKLLIRALPAAEPARAAG